MNARKHPFKNILVIDDSPVVTRYLKDLLLEKNYTQNVYTADCCRQAQQLMQSFTPQCIFLDIRFNNDINGLECMPFLIKRNPYVQVIAFSSYYDTFSVTCMMAAGARGFVSKDAHEKEILQALDNMLLKKVYFCSTTTRYISRELKKEYHLPEAPSDILLTQRQQQVLALMVNGKDTKKIAEELFLSEGTVSTHRKHIMAALNAHSLGELLEINATRRIATHYWGDYLKIARMIEKGVV